MRILVIGAGAIGGYFGGRLLEAGRDVTFLVRPRRAEQLAQAGLSIRGASGDVDLPAPTVQAGGLRQPFDLVLLSCKAFDLPDAMEQFAPAVGPDTAILPMLNGMQHLDMLERRFGAGAVLGGVAQISVTLDPRGRILHLGEIHSLVFGNRGGAPTERIQTIAATLAGAKFDARASESILQEMWEKWVFIATAAGITCLMRSTVGDIVAAAAADLATALLDECAAIARQQGFAPRPAAMQRNRAMLTVAGSGFTASMLRDVEQNACTEVDHVIGDLLRRGNNADPHALLRIACAHLQAYEARRTRTRAARTDPLP
ncbi:MAG TPA: 2-dehydropantoate 2-reductase [Acetobacteraceae bacterium]|nr:2-dehydropantoate 2-reductase [Acetobacteraceae bacterium]